MLCPVVTSGLEATNLHVIASTLVGVRSTLVTVGCCCGSVGIRTNTAVGTSGLRTPSTILQSLLVASIDGW